MKKIINVAHHRNGVSGEIEMNEKRRTANQKKEQLLERKLKAEAELAEMQLAAAKAEKAKPYWDRCLACGGRKGHYEQVGGYYRSGIGGKRCFFPCRACGGRGRQLVYPS